MDQQARRLDRMTWRDVADLVQASSPSPCAVVPIGALEAHGTHAPLGTDIFIADAIATRFAEACGGVLCPPIPVGVLNVGYEFDFLPGSVSLRPQTLIDLCVDYGAELGKSGFDPIIFVNGHGPNAHPLAIAAFEIQKQVGVQVGVLEWWGAARSEIEEIKGFSYGNHADEIETSLVLASAGADAVSLDNAEVYPERMDQLDAAERAVYLRKMTFTHRFDERWVGAAGNMGDPTRAKAESGERIIAATVEVGLELLEALRGEARRVAERRANRASAAGAADAADTADHGHCHG